MLTTEPAPPILELRGVGVSFEYENEATWPFRHFHLQVDPGSMVALQGVSGSGKSTILALAGLLRLPSEGVVALNGVSVDSFSEKKRDSYRRENIGFMFQEGALIEHLTILENVMLPLLSSSPKASRRDASDLLSDVGLGKHLNKLPGAVSGGQAQRAAFCRAIIANPSLVLADEPTSSLDEKSSDALLALLRGFSARGGGVLLATHDANAARIADHVIRLHNRSTPKEEQ